MAANNAGKKTTVKIETSVSKSKKAETNSKKTTAKKRCSKKSERLF